MLIRLLKQYLRPYIGQFSLVVILQFAQAGLSLYLPTLNADIIDKGVSQGDIGKIWQYGGIMLGVSVLQVICTILAVYFGAKTAMSIGRDLRSDLFRRVQDFSSREVARFGAPSLITRTTNDVQQVQMVVLMSAVFILSAPIMMVGGVIMALQQDATLSLLLLVIIPILGVIAGLVVSRMGPQFTTMQSRIDKVNLIMREQITGIRVIRAFVRDKTEQDRFAGANEELTQVSIRVGRLFAIMFPAVMLVMNLSSVSVMWFGGHRIGAGDMEVGQLTAFLSYLMQILMSVMMATMMFIMVPRASVCAGRICKVFDATITVVPPEHPITDVAIHGQVELRGAEFRYPRAAEPVLHDISFVARPGQTTAVIGSTGAGKTTLLNLIPRLFDASAGEVLVDGVDVKDLDEQYLWSRIGLVPQKPYLFAGTVASNLRYGKADATEEEMWHALQIAQADDFVRGMPDGLESEIAQGGTNVSGGQRQRLAIARALIRKPEIYLFDDSFSALDFATDARLRAALKPETAGSTVIIVAQRVGTIRDADQILVLDNGAVVGAGTHDELMQTCETYQEIVLSQMSAEEAVA